MMGTPAASRRAARLSGVWPPSVHDDALGLLDVDDVHDVLERQRLEVEAIGGVVVGGDGLGVAVDHDRLVAARREGRRRRGTQQ